MILVTGASGNVGGELVLQLVANDSQKVRVLARDPQRTAHLPAVVERATGDLTKPETLDAAFAGVKALFLMSTDHSGAAQVQNAVTAAKAAGVKHIVYLSSLSAANPNTQIGRWHKEGEQIVEASGIAWTFLRPGVFMSNVRQWLGSIKARGTVFLPQPDKELHPIDAFDMAAVAAVALTTAGHAGKVYPLIGEEATTPRKQVEILAQAAGRSLATVPVTMEQAREGMARGMPPKLVDAVIELLQSDWDKDEDKVARTMVRKLTGQAPQRFEDWAKRHADEFKA